MPATSATVDLAVDACIKNIITRRTSPRPLSKVTFFVAHQTFPCVFFSPHVSGQLHVGQREGEAPAEPGISKDLRLGRSLVLPVRQLRAIALTSPSPHSP